MYFTEIFLVSKFNSSFPKTKRAVHLFDLCNLCQSLVNVEGHFGHGPSKLFLRKIQQTAHIFYFTDTFSISSAIKRLSECSTLNTFTAH